MGKPESGPPSGQSVEQLLSSIRQAIEADAMLDAARKAPHAPSPPAPGAAPPAPHPAASAPVSAPAGERDDAAAARRYHSGNPYRFRYSLEGSQTYMSLRNRLSSLNSRTRADTGRSMASLLGGDGRREEARPSHIRQEPTQQPEEPPALRSSLAPAEAHVDEFVTSELASGVVSYSPDYHEWSLDQSFDDYGAPPQDVRLPGTEAVSEPVAGWQDYSPQPPQEAAYAPGQTDLEPEPVYEEYAQPEVEAASEPEPEPEPAAAPENPLQLETMIRQIIEPELHHWFDEHMPEHVARAMPDEAAFIAMIRPLIEDWLADNLAPIVEQAVKDEIARITGLKR